MSFENCLVVYGSCTLAGLTCGNLFQYPIDSIQQFEKEIHFYNQLCNPKDIYLTVLKQSSHKAFILLYRKTFLLHILSNQEVQSFLHEFHYESFEIEDVFKHLSNRLLTNDGFPHEIGIFLGYPIEDVKSFIQNQGHDAKCCGCWKVYHQTPKKQQRFKQFDCCKNIYQKHYNTYHQFEKLLVAL